MAQVQESIELENVGSVHSFDREATWDNPTNTEIEQPPLPPPDTGKAAWLVLAGCSLIQIPVWGYSVSFGVFQEYYSSHPEELGGDAGNVAVVGTTVTGILYLASPFTFGILTRWPRLRRWFGPIGLLMTVVGFLISSFCTNVWQLTITQGVLTGLGCGFLFTPTTLYLDEWFIKRKGLAYGIMWAGKSATGVALPFIMDASLHRFGPKATLQGWTVATVILSAPLLYFLRPRIPLSQSAAVRKLSFTFIKLPAFWMLQIGNILQSLGYFLPYTYISSYAVQEIGTSTTIGTLILSLVNVTSVPGGIVLGSLNDHAPVTTAILISSLGSALAVFFFWGFATHTALLTIFAIVYGFFAGGFSSTWSGVLTDLKKQSPALDTGLIFGLLAGGRGIGNVISGPLSVAMVTKDGWLGGGKSWGYGGEYGAIILFTGATSLLGGWGWFGRYCSARRV
ncbi:major facilitator superfamily domain-containing protein [Lophiotrema nucula]|uniref:Major facilitator superfamily domain-containing protein n=1 Tax=Lophiotrema nucula TaxID=690887 RepID=A0A6A5ZC85_9PLEO|nr:major facilitator superfamily domain-containing protein [Lophiotrema nucula]